MTNVVSPFTTARSGSPIASAADAACIAFITLWRETPAIVTGMSISSSSGRDDEPSSTVIQPSSGTVARPPSARVSRIAGCQGSSEQSQGRPVASRRIERTRGSSAFSTSHPSGRVIRVTVAFTSASWSIVWIPWRPRWSSDTFVTTATSLWSTPIPRSRMPPRAVSRTATSGRSASARAAPPNPE